MYEQWYPNIFYDKLPNGEYKKFTFEEQAVMNILFNLGYIILDYKWLIYLKATEPSYFYRYGFVSADIYGRFFYRSIYEIPIK